MVCTYYKEMYKLKTLIQNIIKSSNSKAQKIIMFKLVKT